ncbi:uncharacterized protein [Pleurodeles waltl]|uniref:uncharacterized protein n=1 Tax=Pleurodeles waltl TaxID=8319 RepID=UPI0037094B48
MGTPEMRTSWRKGYSQIILWSACAMSVVYGARSGDSTGEREGLIAQKFNRQPQMPTLLHQPNNVWIHLAQEVLNISHFCMSNMQSVQDLITTCLVAVPTPAAVLLHIFNNTNQDGMVDVSDVRSHLSLYEYCRHCPEVGRRLWRNMTSILTFNISSGDVCYSLTCDPMKIGKCAQLKLEKRDKNLTAAQRTLCHSRTDLTCLNVNNSMFCQHVVPAASHIQNVKLPKGWLFSCGNLSFTYIPANLTGGPCAWSRLGFLMFPMDTALHPRYTRDTIQLPTDCDSEISLLSKTEYVSLAGSIVGVPGLAVYNTRVINKLACLVVKNINYSSAALAELLLDVQGIRRAALQNRAAIDYLLLKHNHGCSDFEGLCCFNLSDHSTSINSHIEALHKLVKGVQQDVDKGWWDWAFGWLPNLGQLRYIFGVIIIITVILISLCCCIQCVPNLLSQFRPRALPFQLIGYT